MEKPEALECSLTWCTKGYHDATASNGLINTSNISEFSLRSPSEVYNFTVNLNDHNTIADFLATFFTTSNQDATTRALWTSPNISQTMSNIATSMTNNIREGVNATPTQGTAALVETYIHVSWAWLILPVIVVLMGPALLVLSIIMSSASGARLWKSSSLALLFSQLKGWERIVVRANSICELQEAAKDLRVRLEKDGTDGLTFVRG